MMHPHDLRASVELDSTLDPKNPEFSGVMPKRLQFSLSNMLILTALMAVGVVLLKNFGHWGLVILTVASIVFTLNTIFVSDITYLKKFSITGRLKLEKTLQLSAPSMRWIVVDLIWGIGLPLLCFSYDPGIIQQDLQGAPYGEALIATALWQMCLLFVWLTFGPRGPVWNGFMAGGMIVGTILAGMLALPFTLLAILISFDWGIGLPGFVPLVTTWVFARNRSLAQFMIPSIGVHRQQFRIALAASLIIALLVPALLVWLANSLGWPLHFPRLPQRVA